MNLNQSQENKIYTPEALERKLRYWKFKQKKIVFTNGCFDLLHPGHIAYLNSARSLGNILIIGLNTDASVQRLKGPSRPINSELDRAKLMASLEAVNAICLFDEDTPMDLIRRIEPDVLVKGGDYSFETIVGAKEVSARGGQVKVIPFLEGHSSSRIIDKIKS